MRLIDAYALIEHFTLWLDDDEHYVERTFKAVAEDDIIPIIDKAPTIEAEPITRCRDCKFYTEEDRWCRRLGLCGAFDPNDYCSHAEEGEEE